ncbi:hypothetical protein ACFY3V_21985 [Streptosporangium sp. NPDC000095]|uniref:hypothetical protein n=1 Tax=Streptosporangium sp. NPDC000095 TaxID=3366184 RepID=UPI00367D17CF
MTDLLEETGDERADAALGGLTRLGALPVSAHADVFEEVFTGLEQALAAVNGTSGRESASPDSPPERATAPAHGAPEREATSPGGLPKPSGVPRPGPALVHALPGQGRPSVDGTRDRRP